MKIDSGFVVGQRWRLAGSDWSAWSFIKASGSTGLIMIYRTEKNAGRNNKIGVRCERVYGYFDPTHGDYRSCEQTHVNKWRAEEVEIEQKVFSAALVIEETLSTDNDG